MCSDNHILAAKYVITLTWNHLHLTATTESIFSMLEGATLPMGCLLNIHAKSIIVFTGIDADNVLIFMLCELVQTLIPVVLHINVSGIKPLLQELMQIFIRIF